MHGPINVKFLVLRLPLIVLLPWLPWLPSLPVFCDLDTVVSTITLVLRLPLLFILPWWLP